MLSWRLSYDCALQTCFLWIIIYLLCNTWITSCHNLQNWQVLFWRSIPKCTIHVKLPFCNLPQLPCLYQCVKDFCHLQITMCKSKLLKTENYIIHNYLVVNLKKKLIKSIYFTYNASLLFFWSVYIFTLALEKCRRNIDFWMQICNSIFHIDKICFSCNLFRYTNKHTSRKRILHLSIPIPDGCIRALC